MPRTTTSNHITIDEYKFMISMVPWGACFVKMLTKSKQQLDAMLSYYSKVYVLPVTVHPRHYTDTNEAMSEVIRQIRKELVAPGPTSASDITRSPYQFKRFGYAWFREAPKGERGKHHYHLVLMLDGHKIRNGRRLLTEVLAPIGHEQGMKMFVSPDDQPFMVERKSDTMYAECLYQLSYFSKVRGKGCKASSSNNYSTSRLKRNPTQTWPGFKNTQPSTECPLPSSAPGSFQTS